MASRHRPSWRCADGQGRGCYAAVMSRERRTYTFVVVVEPAEDAWHAYCPTLLDYGAATWGSTREEAREHLREMVVMIVERLAEENVAMLAAPADPAPMPLEQLVVTVGVPSA
jgi:predicted RNase H-like HicB family nuclease